MLNELYNPQTQQQIDLVNRNGSTVGYRYHNGRLMSRPASVAEVTGRFAVVGYDVTGKRVVLNVRNTWTLADRTAAPNVARFDDISTAAQAMAAHTQKSERMASGNAFITSVGVGGAYIKASRVLGRTSYLKYGQTRTSIAYSDNTDVATDNGGQPRFTDLCARNVRQCAAIYDAYENATDKPEINGGDLARLIRRNIVCLGNARNGWYLTTARQRAALKVFLNK